MHEALPITIFLYLKNVGGELICHQGMSWYEHCEFQLTNYQLYLDEYDHIFWLEVFTGPIFSPNSSPPHEPGSKSIPPQIQNLMGQPPQSISK